MSTVEKDIEVNVPVSTAYNQWTQFESFPKFMEGIKQIRQLDDKRLHWHAEIAGKDKEWDAEITQQIPDQLIAWRSTTGAQNDGIVTFHALGNDKCKIHVKMDYEPEGIIENVGDAFGIFSHRVGGDLERFKDFIESRGNETGAWRGQINQGQSVTSSTTNTANSYQSSANLGANLSTSQNTNANTNSNSQISAFGENVTATDHLDGKLPDGYNNNDPIVTSPVGGNNNNIGAYGSNGSMLGNTKLHDDETLDKSRNV